MGMKIEYGMLELVEASQSVAAQTSLKSAALSCYVTSSYWINTSCYGICGLLGQRSTDFLQYISKEIGCSNCPFFRFPHIVIECLKKLMDSCGWLSWPRKQTSS